MSCGAPCPSTCAPPNPPICSPTCLPPQGLPPCRPKPVMRGLHWAQTRNVLIQALTLSAIGGMCVYFFIGRPRRVRYREFYQKAELEDWADEMARKGLFQSVPASAFKDF